MQKLGQMMTAQEFGLHYALECQEPVPAGPHADLLAALANGTLRHPDERLWRASDFTQRMWRDDDDAPALSAPASEAPQTVEQIMAAARAAGMVQ